MRLHRITVSGRGLKGSTFDEAVGGVDVWVGPNGAGKSTRLIAVLAGLRGVAETVNDASRDYLGPELPHATVDLRFDSDVRISRTLSDSNRKDAAKKVNAVVEKLVGPHLTRWDLSDFATATATERAVLLDRVCDLGASSWTVDRLVGELRASVDPEGEGAPELDRLVAALDPKLSPDKWLQQALAASRTRYTETHGAADTAKTTAESAEQARQSAGESNGNLQEHRARAAALERELAVLDRDLGELVGRRSEAERLAQRAQRDREALAAAEKALADTTHRLAEARAAADGAAVVDADSAIATATAALTQADARERDARTVLDAARSNRDAAAARWATIAALAGQASGCCSACGAQDPLGLASRAADEKAGVDAAEVVCADAAADHKMVEVLVGRARKRLNEAQELRAAARTLADRRRRVTDLEAALAETTRRRNEAAVALADSERAVAERPPVPDARELQQRRDAVAANLGVARKAERAAISAAEREAAYQNAIAKREETKQTFEAVNRLGKALRALQERVQREVFAPLEQIANGVLADAEVELRVAFHSSANFGAERGGAYIPWWSLSDGERAVCAAALSVGFAELGHVSWKAVVIDGLESVDASRRVGLLSALANRVKAGTLHNVLAAMRLDPGEDLEPIAGVTVHRLERAPVSAEAAA